MTQQFYGYAMLLTSILTFGIGTFVWFKNRSSTVNITFGLMSLCVVGWSINLFLKWVIASNEMEALFYSRIGASFSAFIYIAWLNFVLAFLGKANQKKDFLL